MLALPVTYSQRTFSICIITYRRPKLLKRCLDSLPSQLGKFDPCQYQVIVSDDCPARSSRDVVLDSGFATWVQGPNRGVAANRNNAASASNGDWILYLDDDEIVGKMWLETIYGAILAGNFDVIEGRVEPTNFPDSILWYAPAISSGGAYCTANLGIRRDLLLSLGGFNEKLSVSHEDTEMGARIRKAGLRSVYLDEAVVYHPARKLALSQVCRRMINLQLTSFTIKDIEIKGFSARPILNLCDFTLKYWYRVSRFELAARQPRHWRRPILACFLLALTIPFGFLKTIIFLCKGTASN
ncbi:glycosyltransferase [Cyanobium sp. BA20m-p-22]|uniref:glycosyltransferase family 2 protein n=1 Tax=Cyanobium sp. BA20m-p-22 TaxID=2823704 RepID=UPI0020CE31F5|nr:glycosyltransferase [Cyanobium sp. BA20m-p-22]MCP9910311.1 glycosyltransferase [Cyanobium sp. BA20m-p-22]